MYKNDYVPDILSQVIEAQNKKITWMSERLTDDIMKDYPLTIKPVDNLSLSFKIEILLNATKMDFTIKELMSFFDSDFRNTDMALFKAKKRIAFFNKYYLFLIIGLIMIISIILSVSIYVGTTI